MSRFERRQSGQAAVEYAVVLALTTIVLIAVTVDPSVIDEIVAAVKGFFRAFSYAISIPSQDRF
jgi:Flp pilus assembly pilin Flp